MILTRIKIVSPTKLVLEVNKLCTSEKFGKAHNMCTFLHHQIWFTEIVDLFWCLPICFLQKRNSIFVIYVLVPWNRNQDCSCWPVRAVYCFQSKPSGWIWETKVFDNFYCLAKFWFTIHKTFRLGQNNDIQIMTVSKSHNLLTYSTLDSQPIIMVIMVNLQQKLTIWRMVWQNK